METADLFEGFIPMTDARALPPDHPGVWSCICGMAWMGEARCYPDDLRLHADFRREGGETGSAHDPGAAMFRPDTL